MNLPTLIGPLQLDARLCRLMGWTEAEIEEVTTHLHFIAQEHAELCAVRAPELWRRTGNGLVYLGELPADPRAGKRGPFQTPAARAPGDRRARTDAGRETDARDASAGNLVK